VEVVEIVLVAALLRPNVVAVVPSSWRRQTALERTARASVVTVAACRVVEADVLPSTLAAKVAAGYSLVEIRLMVVVVRAVEADDPLVVRE
jgi:hypothetical protein